MTQAFQAAFILHRRPFSDSSFLLEVLSLEHGRQPVMARGARRPRTRFAQLQPFQPLWLGWRGRGEIKSLSHAEPRGAAFRLVEKRLFCGLYLNELVMRMAPRGEPFERLFWIYEEALAALHERAPMEALLRDFELQLLEFLTALDLIESQAVRGVTLLAMAQRDFSDSDVRREALRLMRRVIDHYLDHRTLKSRELFSRTR